MGGLSKESGAAARGALLLVAAIAVAALGATSCKNSVDLVAAVKQEVMKANDKFLEIENVSIPDAEAFSPTGEITLSFDRAIDPLSAVPANVTIRENVAGGAAIDPSKIVVVVSGDRKRITIRVEPYLDTETDYSLTITGLAGADGSGTLAAVTRTFTTGLIAAGSITSLAGVDAASQPGYSTGTSVSLSVAINDAYPLVKYQVFLDAETTGTPVYECAWQSSIPVGDADSATFGTTLNGLAEGQHMIRVLFLGKASDDPIGKEGTTAEAAIAVDLNPPAAPTVSLPGGLAITNDATPTWAWSSGGNGGSGLFQYQLDSDHDSWIEGTALAYTPAAALEQGERRLYVRERDAAGNWSPSAYAAVTIDTLAPGAPVVVGPLVTGDRTPTWTWSSGGGGIDASPSYRWQLNAQEDEGWNLSSSTEYTQPAALGSGSYRLYVQERDAAGNWSASGSFETVVDATPPNAPIVSGPAQTNDTTPTWSWESGGGDGAESYRCQLNTEAGTWIEVLDAKSYTPGSGLANGTYVLHVQERDLYENWSASGSYSIEVNKNFIAPVVLCSPELTTSRRPTWTWSTTGSNGADSYRYQLDSRTGSWTETASGIHSLGWASDLEDGSHTLYIQEKMDDGTWSMSGYAAVTVDATSPESPILAGANPAASASSSTPPRPTAGPRPPTRATPPASASPRAATPSTYRSATAPATGRPPVPRTVTATSRSWST